MFGYALMQGPVKNAAAVMVVGIAPMRRMPVMVDFATEASSRMFDKVASVCCAHASTRSPSAVSPKKRRPRRTIMMPSSFSKLRIADDRAGCDTWQISAALAKCFSRARVTRYSSWRMNICVDRNYSGTSGLAENRLLVQRRSGKSAADYDHASNSQR